MSATEQQTKLDGGASVSADGLGVWRPIETCPMYQDVLFFRNDAGVFSGKITHCAAEMSQNELDTTDLDEETIFQVDVFSYEWNGAHRCDGDLKPTHWMPLPEAPNASLSGLPRTED